MIERLSVFLISTIILGTSLNVFAEDVWVKGYYQSDGTYGRPHYCSLSDSYKWHNYEPSQNAFELANPTSRDYVRDRTPNYLDFDDNVGI